MLLLFVWVQNTSIYAVAWWGFADLLRAGSVALFGMYGSVSDLISIDLANTMLFTAFALTWTGARVFDHRRPLPILLFGGAALWLVVCRIPSVAASWDIRVLLSSGIITTYTWATAYEFWRGRSEPLVSRWPAIFMLFAHGALYLLRTPFGAMLPWSPGTQAVSYTHLFLAHDLIRSSFARRSGLREGGKPVSTFRDHTLLFIALDRQIGARAPFRPGAVVELSLIHI